MMRALLAIVLAACGARPAAHVAASDTMPWAASGIDWTKPPVVGAPARFVPPAVERIELGNGMHVIVIANHRLPIVAVAVLELAAGSRDDGDHPGLAALTADLLDDGAGRRDRFQLAGELARLGARLDLDIATDDASAHLTTLSDHFDEAVELLADVIRRPRFDEPDVARVRATRVAELSQRVDRPRTIAAQLFDRVVFGAHPYAHPAEGNAASVAALTTTEVRAFHARAYGPATTTIVIAGDVTRDAAVRTIEHAFGDWAGTAAIAKPPAIAPHAPELAYVDVPGAAQTSIMIGRVEPMPIDVAAEVGNGVLGGSPTGRLDRKLRDELGAATGAGSSFWTGAWSSTWAISTSVRTESTADAIRAILALVDRARTEDVPNDELVGAQQTLIRAATRSFETAISTTRAIERSIVRGTTIDQLVPDQAVTPASVRAAIAPLWTDLTIVVVGDWATIGPGVRALGLPAHHYTASGQRAP